MMCFVVVREIMIVCLDCAPDDDWCHQYVRPHDGRYFVVLGVDMFGHECPGIGQTDTHTLV